MRVRFNDFILDTDRRELFRGKEQIPLRPKALDLLRILIENRPKAVAQEELYDRLWPKTIIKVLLRHRLRPLLGENLQELKRLGREVHPIAVAQQLVAFRIENEIAEADTH